MFRYYIYKVGCFQPHRCGVVIRVDSDEPVIDKFFVEEEFHFFLAVVEYPERRHRAGYQAEQAHQIVFRCEAQRARAVPFPEFFQVNALVALDGYEIIITFLVVSDKQILRVRLRVRQFNMRHLLHIEHRAVLGHFVFYSPECQEIIYFLIIHNFILNLKRAAASGSPLAFISVRRISEGEAMRAERRRAHYVEPECVAAHCLIAYSHA